MVSAVRHLPPTSNFSPLTRISSFRPSSRSRNTRNEKKTESEGPKEIEKSIHLSIRVHGYDGVDRVFRPIDPRWLWQEQAERGIVLDSGKKKRTRLDNPDSPNRPFLPVSDEILGLDVKGEDESHQRALSIVQGNQLGPASIPLRFHPRSLSLFDRPLDTRTTGTTDSLRLRTAR